MVRPDHTCFAYVIDGCGGFSLSSGADVRKGDLLLFGKGRELMVQASSEGMRFLLVSGKPLGEPVAWGGPIVMNTEKELQTAMDEYREGTFIKSAKNDS